MPSNYRGRYVIDGIHQKRVKYKHVLGRYQLYYDREQDCHRWVVSHVSGSIVMEVNSNVESPFEVSTKWRILVAGSLPSGFCKVELDCRGRWTKCSVLGICAFVSLSLPVCLRMYVCVWVRMCACVFAWKSVAIHLSSIRIFMSLPYSVSTDYEEDQDSVFTCGRRQTASQIVPYILGADITYPGKWPFMVKCWSEML